PPRSRPTASDQPILKRPNSTGGGYPSLNVGDMTVGFRAMGHIDRIAVVCNSIHQVFRRKRYLLSGVVQG
ncbi:hypothetical protein ACCT30_39730, partial [Rhizobium ruizarguesonis]